MMVSCLETYSVAERNREQTLSDYNSSNVYSEMHNDALATGDRQGKGTGHSGHSHWLPHCNGTLGVFNYSNFDTDIRSNAGCDLDNQARNTAITRSLYTSNYVYSEQIIDRSQDIEYQRTIASTYRNGGYHIGG